MKPVARRALAVVTSLPGRLVITAALLAAVALSIDWTQVGDRVGAGHWGVFALAVAALIAGLTLGGVRWHLLLRAAGLPVTGAETGRAYAIGLFANNFLPTSFGGDAARAIIVAPPGRGLVRALVSVLVDRLTALICLVAVCWLLVALNPSTVPGELVLALGVLTVAGAVGLVIALPAMRRGAARFLPARLRPSAAEVGAQLRAYLADFTLMWRIFALGLGFQAFVVLEAWLLVRSVDLDIPLAVIAVSLPLALVATMLPFSIAGFGLREGAYVVILGTAGVSAADATLFSLLSVIAMTLASLPGGLAMLLKRDALVRSPDRPPHRPRPGAAPPAVRPDEAIPSGDE